MITKIQYCSGLLPHHIKSQFYSTAELNILKGLNTLLCVSPSFEP